MECGERAWISVRAVVLSDDAGQFDVGQHALCWIHAERLVHKLETFTDQQRAAQQHVGGLIWWFYADLKAYRLEPTSRRRSEMRTRFDRIFQRHTGVATLDRLLKRLHANKAELLMVLDRPDIPLHTNGSENDIRCQAARNSRIRQVRRFLLHFNPDRPAAESRNCSNFGTSAYVGSLRTVTIESAAEGH